MNRNARPTKGKLRITCKDCSLSDLCLPQALNGEEIAALDALVHRSTVLVPGESLFSHGAPFECLYAVRSGSLKSGMTAPDGREQVVAFHLPGELVGLDAFADDGHQCDTKALETTSVCTLPSADLERLGQQVPRLNAALRRLLGREIVRDQALMLLLGKGSAPERLAAFLLSLSARYAQRGFSGTRFHLSMSRHDIGNYLGLALETVSRQFARLQRARVISIERREVEILDPHALQSTLCHCLP